MTESIEDGARVWSASLAAVFSDHPERARAFNGHVLTDAEIQGARQAAFQAALEWLSEHVWETPEERAAWGMER